MYKNEFDNILKNDKVFKAYMFFGTCDFLIQLYSNIVISKLNNHRQIQTIYFDDYIFKKAKEIIEQSNLFSSNNILLIKTNKPIIKKEIKELVNIVNKKKDSTIIFECYGISDFRNMSTSFTKELNSINVRFFEPNKYEILNILQNVCRESKISFDIEALEYLYSMHKNNLELTINDLKKISITKEHINIKTINKNCFGITSSSIQDLLYNILEGVNISILINDLFKDNINETYLLIQLNNFIYELFLINSYTRINGTANAKNILGYTPPKNIWEKKTKLAIKIKQSKFLNMFKYINNLELDIKDSKIYNKKLYLQSSLIKFSVLFR
jgi:DNA polymerase III subunit delta